MLVAKALDKLTRELSLALGSMGLGSGTLGTPQLVEKSTKEAERIFQGYAKAKPSKEDAYAAAREFVRGRPLNDWQRDLVAAALAEPISEQGGITALGYKRFPELLAEYEAEARRGDLWRLTWHGLLYSYFSYDPGQNKDAASMQGWQSLREFLERTWSLVDREAKGAIVPDWIDVLRRESVVLSAQPAQKYAQDYLTENTEPVERLAADLGIPTSSWFWHALVLEAVRRATSKSDSEFRGLLPRLLKLVEGKPAFRDEAIELILIRYHACLDAQPDDRLRDYVVGPTVWKNPKLRDAGIATAWNRVPEAVWMMVLGWVNKRNLKDFFDILVARNKADEGRLAFWSNYLEQITWTRLVFSSETMQLKNRNPAVRALIASEEGTYAQMIARKDMDAFMMKIGGYILVEFSRKPSACYVYAESSLPFDRHKRNYAGTTDDLAIGFHGGCAARIIHRDGWAMRAAEELRALGIVPDRQLKQVAGRSAQGVVREPPRKVWDGTQTLEPLKTNVSSTSTSGRTSNSTNAETKLSLLQLERLVNRHAGAFIQDSRSTNGGRLWVVDPGQHVALELELKELGFKWAHMRAAWYILG